MAGQPNDNPSTWSALFGSGGREGADAKETIKLLTPSVLANANAPVREAGPLSNTLSRMLVLCGPTEGRALAEPLARLAGPALQQVAEDFDDLRPEQVVNVLSFVNAMECAGQVDGLLARAPVESWLEALMKARRTLHEVLAYRCGLVSLAQGLPELAARFVGGGKLPESFTPGQTFGFNVQGFVRYLATAQRRQARAEEVRPAWETFAEVFPMKRAADTLDWKDLLWAARSFHVGFEHRPVAEVLEAVHSRVKPA
ncbi:hypothetical protein D7Y13_06770 [Corallococcus praedator]|uniref:DUF2378 family protein n=1 Tax=Corallococcus praedator TaxID=2316724 RepID=A0ABX9QNN0_9BACT|nr:MULTISPECIES: hypothetical protein [Corallococcus]RKH20064.1 hypothetical protein D7X74_05120 [Corallococcus sp. CA047B]RKH35812.1 hypothetical protein D7X75_02765 [Corallococcus sp. CA031C]RKI13974.1 hypothetical protein D7Y13_06770 [Corallococcus praedator]